MASPSNSNWAVNFIYEQDLRSEYMNQILMGTLQPGVYNPQIYLCPETPKGRSTKLDLVVGTGTSLVFKNNATSASSDSSPWLIKCTALGPVSLNETGLFIVTSNEGEGTSAIPASFLNFDGSANPPKNYYVFAFMSYNAKTKNANDLVGSVPTTCAYYRTTATDGSFIFKKVKDASSNFPDEISSEIGCQGDTSWLLIGKVTWSLRTKTVKELLNSGLGYNEAVTFSGLGSPAYRHCNMTDPKVIPTLVPKFKRLEKDALGYIAYEGLQISLGDVFYRNTFYKDSLDYSSETSNETLSEESYVPKTKGACAWVTEESDNWLDVIYASTSRYMPETLESADVKIQKKLNIFSLAYALDETFDADKYLNYSETEADNTAGSAMSGTTGGSEVTTWTEASPLDLNVTGLNRKMLLLTEDYPQLLQWCLNKAIKDNIINSVATGTDIFPIAVVIRSASDSQVFSLEDIVPVLNCMSGQNSMFSELKGIQPEFSTINIF